MCRILQDLAESPLKGFAEQRVGQWDAGTLTAQLGTYSGDESLLDSSCGMLFSYDLLSYDGTGGEVEFFLLSSIRYRFRLGISNFPLKEKN